LNKLSEIVNFWAQPKKTSSPNRNHLSPEQLHQMWEFLVNPVLARPPKELEEVSELEWYLASRLLQDLQVEQEHSQVH
jgi:hypothetical protein